RRRIGDVERLPALADHRPAILLLDLQFLPRRDGDPPHPAVVLHRSGDPLERSQELFDVLHRHHGMHAEVGSLGGDEHAEGTPDVEPVQTLALGRQEEHRLDRSGQTGVLH
ncbi:MAG: hypothetical protein ACK55I_14395, partial [bacterium]